MVSAARWSLFSWCYGTKKSDYFYWDLAVGFSNSSDKVAYDWMSSTITPRHVTNWILQIIIFLTSMTVLYYLDTSMLSRFQTSLYTGEGVSGREGAVVGYLLTQTFLIFIIQACARTLTDREMRLKGFYSVLAPWRVAQAASVAAYFCTAGVFISLALSSGYHPGLLVIVVLGVLSCLGWPAIMRGIDSNSRQPTVLIDSDESEADKQI